MIILREFFTGLASEMTSKNMWMCFICNARGQHIVGAEDEEKIISGNNKRVECECQRCAVPLVLDKDDHDNADVYYVSECC